MLGEPQQEGTGRAEPMAGSQRPIELSKEQHTIDQLKMMYSLLHTPLEINVACENVQCNSLLKVSVPENVSRLAPPTLVIRCAGCTKLLSVSLPEETYIQHQIQRLENIRKRQQQMEQMQLLTQEVQKKKFEIEKQMDALIARDDRNGTPTNLGGLNEAEEKKEGIVMETPDVPHNHISHRGSS